ncbi:DUF2249 domain-containing protein [Azohydromonas aeria]|uniref:DUF2249 domain-containing protein n=1 Tax=Azohydromonas aeria TaxID=2590212 RepID=UPI0012FB6ADE|nr:DUF2249 domain-containing protein [Azohydromonas aeria]
MTQPTSGTTIDVRTIVPRERHSLILQTFQGLGDTESMEVVDDHDPRPLYHQLQAESSQPGSLVYLRSGPDVWRVRITKQARPSSDGLCCGACGGA